jgi:hypothetical protein
VNTNTNASSTTAIVSSTQKQQQEKKKLVIQPTTTTQQQHILQSIGDRDALDAAPAPSQPIDLRLKVKLQPCVFRFSMPLMKLLCMQANEWKGSK